MNGRYGDGMRHVVPAKSNVCEMHEIDVITKMYIKHIFSIFAMESLCFYASGLSFFICFHFRDDIKLTNECIPSMLCVNLVCDE